MRALAAPKEGRIAEGHVMAAHGPRLLSRPPQDAGAHGVGCLKGNAASHRARTVRGRRQPETGPQGWARGDDVSPGGRQAAPLGASLRSPAAAERRWEQRGLG